MPNHNHTPGPWIADVRLHKRFSHETGEQIEDSRSAWIHSGATNFSICNVMPWPEIEANANLIAAAPDLLSALEELVDLMNAVIEGDYRPDSFTCQPANIAIKKARVENGL